jgi:hypothetical protein
MGKHVFLSRGLRLAALSSLPMLGAATGAAFDERLRVGFTTWRTACRGIGLRIPTLVDFTLQLLPLAVIGLLLGGLLVLAAGAMSRERDARVCIAAHAGCALSLPVMLVLCALLPPALMLVADALLAALAGAAMLALLRSPSRAPA